MNIHTPVEIRVWTGALVQQLCDLYDEQKTFSQIAEIIGMSRNSCIGKAHRLGLERAIIQLSPEDKRRRDEARANAIREARMKAAASRQRTNTLFRTYVKRPVNDLAERALHIQFLDLEAHHCRFPYGETGQGFTFCGHPKTDGSSYCADHRSFTCQVVVK